MMTSFVDGKQYCDKCLNDKESFDQLEGLY